MVYVSRDQNGKITGAFANPQDYANEELPDDNVEVIAFKEKLKRLLEYGGRSEAEIARLAAIRADATRQDLINRLNSATPVQINTYVDNNMNNLAEARALVKKILLVIATDSRT